VCATSPTSATNPAQPSPSILCVDDSEEMLLICRTVLEAAGYQVFTASGGGGALEFLQFASGQCSGTRLRDAGHERDRACQPDQALVRRCVGRYVQWEPARR
jgi:CheY-like chemotaxis protein